MIPSAVLDLVVKTKSLSLSRIKLKSSSHYSSEVKYSFKWHLTALCFSMGDSVERYYVLLSTAIVLAFAQ